MALSRKQRVTIHDVAAAAGVSSATASRVVNGVPTVDPDLVRRVNEAIEASGYILNPAGRALRRQIASTWRVIIPDLQNPFFISMVAAIEDAAIRNGFTMVLSNSDEHVERERQAIAAAVAEHASGVVLAAVSETGSDVKPLIKAGIPLVLVDRRIKSYNGDAVFVDNRRLGAMAAEHLIAKGYRRLACIAGRVEVSATEDRLAGFREVIEAAGIEMPNSFIRRSDRRLESGAESLHALMALPQAPDALFVTNEPLTAGVYREAQEMRLTLPDDLALVGTDDPPWTQMVRPSVTTVRQPVERIGWLVAEILIAHARGANSGGGAVTLLPTLNVRDSS